jgi:hypothetical protein
MVTGVDLVGFMAAAASLVAVCSTNIVMLRIAMIFSNLFFIAWGILGMLMPALVLHSILLPINVWRLVQLTTRNRPTP